MGALGGVAALTGGILVLTGGLEGLTGGGVTCRATGFGFSGGVGGP